MSSVVKRLRVFAGPNGSGKSTLTSIIGNQFHLGTYVNADEIKVCAVNTGRIDFSSFNVEITEDSVELELSQSNFVRAFSRRDWKYENNGISFNDKNKVDDYFVAFLADVIRKKLLEQGARFSFETVMSHQSKIDFMKIAKEKGFKVYLYFVSLTDPHLNVLRVQTRVKEGGHNVDESKIVDRYSRTMDNLVDAIKIADSAYIFDNSGSEIKLIAQKENGKLFTMGEYVPLWYKKYVLEKL